MNACVSCTATFLNEKDQNCTHTVLQMHFTMVLYGDVSAFLLVVEIIFLLCDVFTMHTPALSLNIEAWVIFPCGDF